jgi:hypothetical protein
MREIYPVNPPAIKGRAKIQDQRHTLPAHIAGPVFAVRLMSCHFEAA